MDFGKLYQAASKVQEQMKKAQEELAHIIVTGESGGGLVKIEMTCRHDVKHVHIDPSLKDENLSVLEDLIAGAYNDGLRKAEISAQEKLQMLTPDIPLPKDFNLGSDISDDDKH